MIESMYDNKPPPIIEVPIEGIPLPEGTRLISQLGSDDIYRIRAESYLSNRKIPSRGLFICSEGEFCNRLVIPYYDRNKRLIYFNARYIGNHKNKEIAKYMGPSKETGVGKGDVVYMPSWPDSGTEVYLTEGEFDALALIEAGLDAGAFGGKLLTENQAIILQDYRPVLCLDNDSAGKKAINEVGDYFLSQGFSTFSYVIPPPVFKDWNEMLIKVGPRLVRAYILTKKKEYGAFASLERELDF
jgi:DNA primase